MTMNVVTATQAAARDAAAIAAGTESFELMQRAGQGAARALCVRFGEQVQAGVVVFVGGGNNGGDGWVVAAALKGAGFPVRVIDIVAPRTADAIRARDTALPFLDASIDIGDPGVVVDALLGTGATGALRAPIDEGVTQIRQLQANGAKVVALDLPTGLDASTGDVAAGGVVADLTIAFGTLKRGHLVARAQCGDIAVVDIGLGTHASLPDDAPQLVDERFVRQCVPFVPADAHKGVRKKLLIIGGERGMAGAVALAAHAALRSGIGMVRVCVAPESLAPLQASVIEATAIAWPDDDADIAHHAEWADALLIGPGLGGGRRPMVESWLRLTHTPVVLDADALNAFAGDAESLGAQLAGRRAVLTPHAAEFARLTNLSTQEVLTDRWRVGGDLARRLGATVLLKGVPTVISAPDGVAFASAAGTPALATAGSGDVLSGIVATLVAQMDDVTRAAACAAWIHGRAAECATPGRRVRGITLADVLRALRDVWSARTPLPNELLAFLPAVGEADE